MTQVGDIRKGLSGVWAKESDPGETYELEFLGETSWSCVRRNNTGPRKFRLSYDKARNRLWWGESYFLDPGDLASKPDRAGWYRAADTAKKRVAFLWKKVRDAPVKTTETALKVMGKAASSTPLVLKGAAPKSIAVKAPSSAVKATDKAAGKGRTYTTEIEAAAAAAPAPPPPRKTVPTQQLPEVIRDLDQMLVIYKPPHWKCELPAAKGADLAGEEPHSERRGPRDPQILLQWIRDNIPSIDAALFEEDFNPALSGTGFGPLSHRIDQETSGPMLVAKTRNAQRHLKAQFHRTEISKRYLCLVHGQLTRHTGVIDRNIRTLRTGDMTQSEISSAGDWAETKFQVVATYSTASLGEPRGYSLVACDITSGRTHQIRVHMAHLGHALVADDKYISEARLQQDRAWCPRMFLHSYRLAFRNLRNEEELVVCPLPEDLRAALVKLGAADPSGPSSDLLFEETSWLRELFRPEVSQWSPGARVQRCVAALLAGSPNPVPVSQLNADRDLRQLMASEGLPGISKAWLSKHGGVFETCTGNGELCVRLRPAHTATGGNLEHHLERRIEAVRCELEELHRQKQRAIAEEEYMLADALKRRAEAAAAELGGLLDIRDKPEEGVLEDEASECEGEAPPPAADRKGGAGGSEQKKKKPPHKAEAFAADVRDEELFPSLGAPKPIPKRATSIVRGEAANSAAAAAGSGSSAADAAAESAAAGPVDLKDALVEFLSQKEGCIAHMNEVNNDKFMRHVMASQQPKPVMAVNKAFVRQHDDLFAILRTRENETYVGLRKAVESAAAKSARLGNKAGPGSPEQLRTPAYHQVIQKPGGEGSAPLVYKYSAAARSQAQSGEAGAGQTGEWQSKFLGFLRNIPHRSCSAEDLLKSVPAFGDAVGARGAREQQEILVMFLEASPDLFRVERRGVGKDRQYIIVAK